jgi:hypothetical protein
MKKLIIAVDFDGTVCIGNNYPDIGNPRMWLINMLKGLRSDGHKLILWTCRSNSSIPDMGFNNAHDLDDAVEWCRQFGLEFDAVNENLNESKYPGVKLSRKIYADIYVDDKACLFLDGEENLAIIGTEPNSGDGKIIKLFRMGE